MSYDLNPHHQHAMAGEPGHWQPSPPRYVMLSDPASLSLQPPPGRRNVPRYYSRSPRRRHSCSSCACFCLSLLLLLFLLLALLVYLFFFLDPKPPSYSVSHLTVSAFDLAPDLTLRAELSLSVRAENPNSRIAIAYASGGAVQVAYHGAELCAGRLPAFFQGHHNTTTVSVVLKGESPLGAGLHRALKESAGSGGIPLQVYVKVPVWLRLAEKVDLRTVKVSVLCSLVVDSLQPNRKVSIKSAQYKFNVEF
ncbi:NDR1/HIN1-like protein 6 [Wolffia australiana]